MSVGTGNVIRQLIAAYQQQQFAQVVQYIAVNRVLLRQDPAIVQVYAGSLRQLGKVSEAEKALQKGLKTFKKHPELLNTLGNLHLSQQCTNDAVMALRQAVRAQPDNPEFLYNLGRALKAANEWDEAEKLLRRVLKHQPAHPSARIHMAEILSYKKQPDKAEEQLRTVLTANPGNIVALNNCGNLLRKQKRYDEAAGLFERACSLQPGNSTLLRNYAATLALAEQRSKAKAVFLQAVQEAPGDWTAQEELAGFLWEEGESEPFFYIEKQLGSSPHDLAFWFAYIRLLIRADEFTKALSLLDKVEQVAPDHPDLLVNKARVLREVGEYQQSLSYATRAPAKVIRDNPGLLSEAGYTLLSLGRPREALQRFESLIANEPKNQGWWTMRSTCWFMLEQEDRYHWLCNYQDLITVKPVKSEDEERARFNNQLRETLIDMHQNQRHPIGQSLRNGTQTYEDLFDDNSPVIKELGEEILRNAREFVTTHQADKTHPFLSRLSKNLDFIGSWSVRLRSGGFHRSHYHPEGWLSGVYYVDVPQAVSLQGQGWLMFGRADIANQTFAGDYAIKPEAGYMALFPSYMWHGTNPFSSDHHRLTVAFDIIPTST